MKAALTERELTSVVKRYGNEYDEIYKTFEQGIEIWIVTCPDHGRFKIKQHNFMNYRGCLKCKGRHKRGIPISQNGEQEMVKCISVLKVDDRLIQIRVDDIDLKREPIHAGLIYSLKFANNKSVIAVLNMIQACVPQVAGHPKVFLAEHEQTIILLMEHAPFIYPQSVEVKPKTLSEEITLPGPPPKPA